MYVLNTLEEGSIRSMDLAIGVYDVLITMQATQTLFKSLINFILLVDGI